MSAPRLGRPPRVSRAAIIDAVLELGFEPGTVTGIAAHLGVDPSTLYRHIESRSDMLDAAAGAAIDRASWPAVPDTADEWRPFLEEYATQIWRLFSDRPGLAIHLRTAQTVPPQLVRHTLLVVAYLHDRVGLTVDEAAVVVDTVGDLTIDAFLIADRLDRETRETHGLVGHYAELAAALAEGDPRLAALAPEYLRIITDAVTGAGGRDRWWRRKLGYVLDGVAHGLPADGRRAGSRDQYQPVACEWPHAPHGEP